MAETTGKMNDAPANLTLLMMQKFHSDGKYCDVEIQVNGEIFKSQRSVLAGASEYFDVMFSSDFKESNTNNREPITLHEMDATAFKQILNFMYTGEICVTDSNVFELFFMSDFLRLRSAHIEEQCVKYVQSRFQKSEPMPNAIDLLSFACIKTKNNLVDMLSAHVCQNLRYYSKDVKLMEMSFENLNMLLRYVKGHILSLPGTENVMLGIILSWVNYSRNERSNYRGQLMKNINFSNISPNLTLLFINRLETLTDTITGIRTNTKSPIKTLKKLKTEVEAGIIETNTDELNDGDARSEATITFEMKNLSAMKMNEIAYSKPYIISNLLWKIRIDRKEKSLAFYLRCEGTTQATKWSCCAEANLIIVSQKKGDENVKKRMRCLFSSVHSDWGFNSFLSWDNLVDPQRGHINNDSVTFWAQVRADVPLQGIILGEDKNN